YALRKVIDTYVSLSGEDLGHTAKQIEDIVAQTKMPKGVRVDMRGMVAGMRASFLSFGMGLGLALVLLYLILVAQFRSLVGLMPMAIKLGTGSEAYAPLARAIIGGMSVSLVMTVFIVPAAYLLVYRNREAA